MSKFKFLDEIGIIYRNRITESIQLEIAYQLKRIADKLYRKDKIDYFFGVDVAKDYKKKLEGKK